MFKADVMRIVLKKKKSLLDFQTSLKIQYIVFTWHHGGHIDGPKQPSENLIILLCKWFLLFHGTNMAVGQIYEWKHLQR